MLFSNILHTLRNATPTGHRASIVFKHKDIECGLLADKVRDRLVDSRAASDALDQSMPYDLGRPRFTSNSITVDSLFKVVVHTVPRAERNAVLGRLAGRLSYLHLGPCEVLEYIAEEHFVENEREE